MSDLLSAFPALHSGFYKKTSPSTHKYNCIGWAASNDTRWWWPVVHPFVYWPSDVPREETLNCFVVTFKKFGFEPCESRELEAGYEKVAIYVNQSGVPTHMARQLSNGNWTSKLGNKEDIEHATLQQLEGTNYGTVSQILKRRLNPTG